MTTTLDANGAPWWIAKEVCDILGLGNITEALRYLDDDEKMGFRITKFQTPSRGGDSGKRILINEPGLYALVIRSRKPEAKAFKRWITHIVLPEIRRTGAFLNVTADMTDAEIMALEVSTWLKRMFISGCSAVVLTESLAA